MKLQLKVLTNIYITFRGNFIQDKINFYNSLSYEIYNHPKNHLDSLLLSSHLGDCSTGMGCVSFFESTRNGNGSDHLPTVL